MVCTCILSRSITSYRWSEIDWWSGIEIQQSVVGLEPETNMAEASEQQLNLSAAGARSSSSTGALLCVLAGAEPVRARLDARAGPEPEMDLAIKRR